MFLEYLYTKYTYGRKYLHKGQPNSYGYDSSAHCPWLHHFRTYIPQNLSCIILLPHVDLCEKF